MRIVLADIKSRDGFLSKDTVAGGYGSRLRPFSKVTTVVAWTQTTLHDLPSVHLAYAAARPATRGHEVVASSGALVDGDVASCSPRSSTTAETEWARRMRAAA